MTAERERRDEEKIKALEIELHGAWDEITQLRRSETHRIMCLEAEIRSRSAASEVMRQDFELEVLARQEEMARLRIEVDRLRAICGMMPYRTVPRSASE